jgi:hypothetical protein
MIFDRYTHIQKLIENGIDEFFDQVFEENYIGLSNEELNFLLILSCEKNEFHMAKTIFEKSKKIETKTTYYFIFIQKHDIIKKTTLEICLLRAINNGNYEIYKWLKEIGICIPQDKIKLYWKSTCKSACKTGNYFIIQDVFESNSVIYEEHFISGLKIILENGCYELFKNLETNYPFAKGEWLFDSYLKNKKPDFNFFSYIYFRYQEEFNTNIFYELISLNMIQEINLVLNQQNYNQETIKNLLNRYYSNNKLINLTILKLLLNYVSDMNFRTEILYNYIIYKLEYLDEIKDLIGYYKSNTELISKIFETIYEEYQKRELSEMNMDTLKNMLEFIIEIGYIPEFSNNFYYYYVEKKERIVFENI